MENKTKNNINNYGGLIITGDVYGGTFGNGNQNTSNTNISATINNPEMIDQLLEAAEKIRPNDIVAQQKVLEIKNELKTREPRTGKLQALYDWLRKNCTGENVLNAIKVFGELLFKVIER